MIEKIIIKNFQKHKNLEIKLDKFNLIIGKSSTGKTSIFRALCFLFYGKWNKTYPNNPDEPTTVSIFLNNGIEITRIRDKDNNKAYIKDSYGTQYDFVSFGEVIPMIDKIIDVSPYNLGDDIEINLNFSFQDDPHFILSKSSTIRTKWFGYLYGANILNSMLKYAQNDKNDITSEIKEITKKIKDLEQEKKKYDSFDKIKEKLNYLNQKFERYEKMVGLLEKILSYKSSLRKVKALKKFECFEIQSIEEKIKKFKTIKEYENLLKELEKIQKLYEKYKKIEIEQIKEKLKKFKNLALMREKLINLVKTQNLIIIELEELKKNTNQLYDLFSKQDVCPFCGNKLKEKEKEKVLKKISFLQKL